MKESEFAQKMGPIVAAHQNFDNYELPDLIDSLTGEDLCFSGFLTFV